MSSHSVSIGNIGETMIKLKLRRDYGIKVSSAYIENYPCDFVMDIQNRLYKVQVKTTEFVKNGFMKFVMTKTDPYHKKIIKYSKDEIDLFMLYCLENDYCGLVLLDEVNSRSFVLKLDKNEQCNKSFKYADEFDLNIRLKELINTGQISKVFRNKLSNIDELSVEEINEIIKLKDNLSRNELALRYNISVRILENIFRKYNLFVDTYKKYEIEVNGIIDSGRGWARRLNIGTNRINSIIRYKGLESAKQFILDNYDFSKENNS